MDYRQSGVDIDAGNEAVRRIKRLARSTFTPAVLSEIGSFGGLFRLDAASHKEPVLVASADGVGTKLKIAFMTGRHASVGADLVNHCVNDILVQGAVPLFFLDYLATGRLSPDVVAEVVGGMAEGCRANGCALLGGETAEMPGFYADGEYDLAGFIVGIADRAALVTGSGLAAGDVFIGLSSSGLHTNGYSLARHVLFERMGMSADSRFAELDVPLGEELLRVHRSYLAAVRPMLDAGIVKAMAHITGGGITENLPRVLPEGIGAVIEKGAWTVPPIFQIIREGGAVPDAEMYRTFNMGIGLIVACAASAAGHALELLRAAGESDARVIGRAVDGKREVSYGSI
jgi:phosphoribosylformylglycinamidine cyclo-ligase